MSVPEAANVCGADVVGTLPGERRRLQVRALAEAHSRARHSEELAVVLGAVERCLQHGPGGGEVLAEESDDAQRRIGGGVVLHVDGHRRAGVTRGVADQARVVERHGFVERLADGGELHGHLGGGGEALVSEAPRQRAVRLDGRLGCRCVEGVLAEVIERDMQPLAGERSGDPERVVDGLAGDEAADHVAGHRRGR